MKTSVMKTLTLGDTSKEKLLIMCKDEKLFPEYEGVAFHVFDPIVPGMEGEESDNILVFTYKHEHRYVDEEEKREIWAHEMHFLELCLDHIPKRIFEYQTKDLIKKKDRSYKNSKGEVVEYIREDETIQRYFSKAAIENYNPTIDNALNKCYDLYRDLVNPDSPSHSDFRLKAIQRLFDSEEFEEDMKKLVEKRNFKSARVDRVGKYLGKLSDKALDKLLNRFKKEYNDEYSENPYYKGSEPYFNHKTRLFADYVNEHGKKVEVDEAFCNHGYIYRNYMVQLHCGQGCFTRILKKNGKGEFENFLQE